MRVSVERSGGLLGRTVHFEIDGDALPDEQRRALEAFAASMGGSSATPSGAAQGSKPDAFHYTLTVESDGATATASLDEAHAPGELLEAVHWVTRHGTRR